VLSSVNRNEAQAVVRKYGGHPGTTISKKTDYLVYGSKTGSKYKRAKKLGIKVLSEHDFFDLIKKERLL
jgi:DNA ligase (NAD+)